MVHAGCVIALAGEQRAHGAAGLQIEGLRQLNAAFGDGRAGHVVAVGDLGHRVAVIDKTGDQSETVEREAGIALADHLAHKSAQQIVKTFSVRRLRMA